MKTKRKILIIFLVVSAIVFYVLFGDFFIGQTMGKWMMSRLNSTVQNGYFIDGENGIKFKVPSDYYVSQLQILAPSKFDRSLWMSPKTMKTFKGGDSLRSIYYRRLPPSPEDPIKQEIETEIWNSSASLPGFMAFFMARDFRVEKKEAKPDRGILIYSSEFLGRRRIKEMYGIKNKFLVWCVFSGGDLDQRETESIFEGLMTSFERTYVG